MNLKILKAGSANFDYQTTLIQILYVNYWFTAESVWNGGV